MSAGKLLHSNLCLLGYGRQTSPANIKLSDDLFEHTNERAFQAVSYFLLRQLDAERCRLAFRDCWPVLDKKQANLFRQTVASWLKEIKQVDTDAAHLPLLNTSLFLAPGGRKFTSLMFALSQYVLVRSMRTIERGRPSGQQLLMRGDADLQCGVLRAASALAKQRFLELQRQRLASQTHHQRFADEFASTYRRLRAATAALTQKLGRLVAVSELPPELTHRLLQQSAQLVVPDVYEAARHQLLPLAAALQRLRRFSTEVDYSHTVVDSVVSGHAARSAVDASQLSRPSAVPSQSQPQTVAQSDGDVLRRWQSDGDVEGDESPLDLVAFFDSFVAKVDQLTAFLPQCNVGQLRDLHGSLAPLVTEARQSAAEAGRLLAALHIEMDASRRRVQRLLAEEEPAPRPVLAPVPAPLLAPLLAPTTPSWSLESAPPPPAQHPLSHLYRTETAEQSMAEMSYAGARLASDLTSVTSVPSPWTSPPSSAERAVFDSLSAGVATSPSSLTAAAGQLRELDSLAVPVPGEVGHDPGIGTSRGSLSSLFSPLASGGRSWGLATACSSDADICDAPADHQPTLKGVVVTEPSAVVTEPAAVVPLAAGSPSAELLQLRQRTSALIRSLRSPQPSPAGGAAATAGHQQLPVAEATVAAELQPAGGDAWLAQPVWQKAVGAPLPLETCLESATATNCHGTTTPDGAATYRVQGSELPTEPEAQLSFLHDQMAELLAMSAFGSGDLSRSLDLSLGAVRESFGGLEIPLVAGQDDTDTDTDMGRAASSEPPTDALVDL